MSYQPTNIESRRIMTETIKTLLQPIQERLDDALMHQTLDPADYADMAWKTTPDTARLLAAVQAVESWCMNLDAIEESSPSSLGSLNASAGAIANVLRKSVAAALTEAR